MCSLNMNAPSNNKVHIGYFGQGQKIIDPGVIWMVQVYGTPN